MITFPNQKIIHINKETTGEFLQINKDDWMQACNELTYNAFKVYLYLAGNQDGFDLALSKKALFEVIKMSENTYTNVIKELTEKKYIVHKQGNIYDFYTIPHSSGIPQYTGVVYPNTVGDDTPIEWGSIPQSTGAEIDKRDKKDIFYINESEHSSSSEGANAPVATPPKKEREKKRTLEELSNEELKSLKDDFEAEVQYKELYPKYNLRKNQLDKNLCTNIDNILSNRQQDKNKEQVIDSLKEDEYSSNKLKELMHLNDEDLVDFLSSLEDILEPFEVVCFFEDNPVFTYDEYLKEDTSMNYFEWFKMGIHHNFRRW